MFQQKNVGRRKTRAVLSRLKEMLPIIVWPLVGLLLVVLLHGIARERIAAARDDVEARIREQASAVTRSYALQLRHMVEQIDQITLRLKHHWEDPDIPVDLERDQAHGLFPASRLLYATIFDARGNPLTSTVSGWRTNPTNVSDLPYFQFHRANCCAGLLISEPSASRFMGRTVVRFTRRLNRPDGGFAGVVSVAVEPPYLTAFQENAAPGPKDFVSVRLDGGTVLATAVSPEKKTTVFYRRNPYFPHQSGVFLESGSKFRDDTPRYVAWHKLDRYPLVALAGFAEHDALAPFYAEAQRYREAATLGSALILVLSGAAAYIAAMIRRRRRKAEETQEIYRLATDAAHEGFYMIRPLLNRRGYPEDFQLEDCNEHGAQLIGSTRDELLGTHISQLRPQALAEDVMKLCRIGLEKGFVEEEVRVAHREHIKADWIYRRIVRSGAGLAFTVRDVSQAKRQEQQLARLANNDTLTGLPNRNWLNSYLPDMVAQLAHGTQRLALLFIDLDNFKNINDTLGHEAGDELLVQTAHRLQAAVRGSDHVARLGGDEFVVVLEQFEIEEDVARVANAIIQTVSQPYALAAGTGNQVNASIGISLFPQDGTDTETLLKHADIAMYAAKAAGKGRYAFYQSHLSDALLLRLSKENALREAIDKDQFVVHFQPRVGVQSGRMTSMEALVRWHRPEHGMVYPADFIDLAEDMGLIVTLGEMVIAKVCDQLAQWQAQGLPPVPVSVNVSSQQLKSGTLSGFLASCIARHGIDAHLLEVELTESAVIDRSVVVSNELAALRRLGIKLMIDDFGTGYSSMAQLHRLDVDVLKVDREFTKALAKGSEGELLFRAIMSMAEALDMCVVAEGVETEQELSVLENLSCDEIQGHIVSEAVDAAAMTHLIIKRFLLDAGPEKRTG